MTMMKTMTRTKMTFKLNSFTILFLLLQIDLNAFKVSSEDVVTRLSTSVNSPSNNTSNSNNIYNSNNIKVKLSETVESDSSSSNSNDGSSTAEATTVSNLYVATTTKYVGKSTKALSSEEQVLVDDDDDDYSETVPHSNADAENRQFRSDDANQFDMSSMLNILKLVSSVAGTAVVRAGKSTPTANIAEGSGNITDRSDNETTNTPVTSTAVAVQEGRYIKGDPLNGYYDFIVTEGSYKFWAAFQLATAALIIYSTFAAIYYSKVNPLTSDYDYIDYLSKRSFSGRSLTDDSDSIDIDVGDGDGDNAANSEGRSSNGLSYWSSLVTGQWLGSATHAFQFVLDAIEKVPQ